MKLNKNQIHNFQKQYIEEYCNLEIYPQLGILEQEAGLLNDFCGKDFIINGSHSDSKQFLRDNLKSSLPLAECDLSHEVRTCKSFQFSNFIYDIIVSYVPEDIKNFELIKLTDVILALENEYFDSYFFKKVKIHGLEKVLYLTEKGFEIFEKEFKYYFKDGIFKYNNLICYTMIVKNAGKGLEKVLLDNLPIIDRWCILDTGSTDGTQELIKRVLKDKKGQLFEEPFVDFKVSRNRCLELAGTTCKFICMLDDTYSICGDLRDFLQTVRGDQFSDSFSLLIQSDDNEYYSNRIIKSESNLRYIHTIHEVINNENNVNVTIPNVKAFIFDNRSEYMEKRTMDRKQFDLELLFKELEEVPDDPRTLYYIAQTYGCIGDEVNKAKYFELRIKLEGYFQEKIDSLFELARTYNFKINPVTKQPLTEPLTESQWKICEDLYIQAYNMDPKRPDSLYFIGIHYYLQGKKEIAYSYMKQAFEVGYPLNSQYSLKPTLSFHFLPKFLAELCYIFNDFQTGKKCCELFLSSSKFNRPGTGSWNLMLNWYKIHENMCKMPQIESQPKTMDRPILAIVTDGGWQPWTGKDILTKGLGGSETWIVEMAKHLSKHFYVVVFCKTDQPEFFEDVGYNPIGLFHEFIATTQVEHIIVSRYTEYIPVAIHGHSKNVHMIFHDNLTPELVIPIHPKIKNVWGLTGWHAKQIKSIFPQFNVQVPSTMERFNVPAKRELVSYINYGIDQTLFNGNVKTKNSFIYSSFPNRGLIVLLKMWPKIIKEFPDATLNIYCDIEQQWVNQVAPEMMQQIKKLLKVNKTGVKVHGWVSKKQLAEAWNTAEYFLYPCIFEETFCLTALEAAISKTCIITNGLAALSETAKHGVIIEGNPLEEEWQVICLETLKKINGVKQDLVEKNYAFAHNLTWESQAKKLLTAMVI